MGETAHPAALRAALDAELEGAARGPLNDSVARTSDAYRAGRGSAGVIRSADDALAYAMVRAPATYAAALRMLEALALAAPGFAPRSLTDVGVGTGAASWAAAEVFPGLAEAAWIDASPTFLEMAGRLAAGGPAALAGARAQRGDVASALPAAELVLAAYVLAEVAADRLAAAAAALWDATTGVLAVVEPGTPAGWARILAVRDQLIAAGANILAPCPHMAPCPLSPPDWCHFAVRLPRSRDHRQAKAADAPFEDEKFIYLAAARPEIAQRVLGPRVLAPPAKDKTAITLKLCTPAGTCETRTISRRDKPAFKAARRLGWGDVLP